MLPTSKPNREARKTIKPSEVRLGAGVVDMYQNSVYSVLPNCDYGLSMDRNVRSREPRIGGGDY